MDISVLKKLTLDTIVEHIARGHAFNKHVLGEDPVEEMNGINAFRKRKDKFGGELGPDLKIETVMDLRHYIQEFLDHTKTEGAVRPRDGSVILYNSDHNVMMCVSPNDRDHDYGSVFRYASSREDYEDEHEDALYTEMRKSRHPYRRIDNFYPGSVRAALEDHIKGIQSEPEKYTAKATTRLTEARFLIALGNENRPGRKDVQGARNNCILHSPIYADQNHRNIFGPESIAREDMEAEICELDCFDEEFETVEMLKQRGLGVAETDANNQSMDQPGML